MALLILGNYGAGTHGEKGGKFEKGSRRVTIEGQGSILAASSGFAPAQLCLFCGYRAVSGAGVVGLDELAKAEFRSCGSFGAATRAAAQAT